MNFTTETQSIDVLPNLGFLLNSPFIYIWGVLFFIILFFLIRFIVKQSMKNSSYHDNVIYAIRLPKDKAENPNSTRPSNELSIQEIREEIAKGETVFASIGGLRAQRTIKAWFLGRNDHFSFEIAASRQKISFYVIAPRAMGRYMEQQINGHYPDANIEEVSDYNIFNPNMQTVAGYLRTKRNNIFPLKTYLKQDTDLMNSILNVMSKLDDGEGMAIQYTVRSAKAVWHRKAASIVREVHQGKSVNAALSNSSFKKVLGFFGDAMKTGSNDPLTNQPKTLTAMEQEMLKSIEEKNGKAGLDVNLRFIVSAKNKGQANIYLDNLSNAFSQYNHFEYGNSFNNRILIRREKRLLQDYIYRRFNTNISFLLNTEELASLFHFPLKNAETPNIDWLTAKSAPAPADIPTEGIFLGTNRYRGVNKEVHIKRADRRRHMYIIGKSGGGKSQFVANMAVQDVLNGEGVCVLDPHGDLVEDIIQRVPPERAEDVIFFNPADTARPMPINLIEYDQNYPEQKTFVINELINIFDKLYDLKSTGGPIFEQYMRNALLLIMAHPESGSTLMEIPKVLADENFRKMKLENCPDQTVVDFWRQEAEKAGGDAALANVVPYITSKLTQFISNDTMRPIIGQQNSAFNFRDIMDKQKILLINLSKGAIGELNAYLLGMVIIGKILMASLSRTDIPEESRKDFYLYIDEFQNFTTDSIASILSEARKYGLNLIIAHQYIGQLVKNQNTEIRDAVFGNVGSMVTFRIGSDDADMLEKEFGPVFNQHDLLNIEKYTTYVKLLVDNTASRPFSMNTPWPIAGTPRPEISQKIKTLSRLKYGQDRNIIEAEIRQRTRGVL